MMENIFSALAENFDLPLLDWIAENLTSPLMDTFMPYVTALGNGGIFWIAAAVILLLIPKYRKTGLQIAAALLIGLLVCNMVMKPAFARIRPYDYQLEYFGRTIPLLIEAPHDFSFPSGHTIASFEAATVVAIRTKKWGIPALILAGLIAFSRLYLYVHYPTDVLCATVLGISIGCLACRLVDKLFDNRKSTHA